MSEISEPTPHCANCAAWLSIADNLDVDALTSERDEAVRARDELRAKAELLEVVFWWADELILDWQRIREKYASLTHTTGAESKDV